MLKSNRIWKPCLKNYNAKKTAYLVLASHVEYRYSDDVSSNGLKKEQLGNSQFLFETFGISFL